jgi:hypothetical protein
MITTFIANPKTGARNMLCTLFFNRQTGDRVNGIERIIVTEFSEGLAVAQKSDSEDYGYVDIAGAVVIPFQYHVASPFYEGRAVASLKKAGMSQGADGLIDRIGQWIVPPGRYEELGPYREGRCAFRLGNRWGLLDGIGKVVVGPRFVCAKPPVFYSELAVVQDAEGRVMYIDRNGQVVIKAPERTQEAYPFHDGLAQIGVPVKQEDGEDRAGVLRLGNMFGELRFGYIGLTGSVVIHPSYTAAREFSEGLAAVRQNVEAPFQGDRHPRKQRMGRAMGDSWGYIDGGGKVVIPFQFENAGSFSCGLARVQKKGRWGYIAKSGQYVIPSRYEWASDFRNGLAEVWHGDKICFIDRTGKVVVNTGLPAITF